MPPAPTAEQALRRAIAQAVRDACLRAAREQCEEARIDGLCWEGAWEAALAAIERLDLEPIVGDHERAGSGAD